MAKRSWRGCALQCASWLVAAGWMLVLSAGPALAERKVALVIGNADYKHTRPLPNPKNDAEGIADVLVKMGFAPGDVTLKLDLDYNAMRAEVRSFAAKVSGADMAIVYYAGHGVEVGGTNYLVPIDAKLARDLDLEYEAITLDSVLAVVGEAKKLKLVILDACRNNPLGDKMTLRAGVTRTWTRGLTAIETKGDMMVAYAAKAGTVALDGKGKHSPFADALIKHMPTPGLDVFRMLGKVKEAVLEATNRQQEPHVYGSPGGETIALVTAPPPPKKEAVTTPKLPPMPDLPPHPSVFKKEKGGEKSTGASADEVAVRICREVGSTTSLMVLDVLLEEHKGTRAGRCISARIAELSKASEPKGAEKKDKTALLETPKTQPTPKVESKVVPKIESTPKVEPTPKIESKADPLPKTPTEAPDVLSNSGKSDTPPPKYDPKPYSSGDPQSKELKGYDGKSPPKGPIGTPPLSSKAPGGPSSLSSSSSSSSTPAPVTECDRIASSPDSVLPGLKATSFALLKPSKAISVCQDAVGRYPTDARLMGLLGRALHKAGRFDEARRWYEKAAEKGDKVSLNNLGSMYEGGQGVPSDLSRARSYYERAVDAGNAFSMRNMGRLFEYGLGVGVDYGLARSWYEKSAQKGEPAGMYELGRLYQEGKGVPLDFVTARSWYERAAETGYAPGMTGLGWLHETGSGMPVNLVMARSWYEKAADGGESTGAYNLARMIARGAGGSRDPRAAARYLLAAARGGHNQARNELDSEMRTWDEEIRRAVLELLRDSGDYRGGISAWWDRSASEAARAYYLRIE